MACEGLDFAVPDREDDGAFGIGPREGLGAGAAAEDQEMLPQAPDAVWVLEGFSKADDTLQVEHPISREQLLLLREVITPDADDPWMIYCYPVPVEVWPAVDAILHCGPPSPELDYLTGAYAAE